MFSYILKRMGLLLPILWAVASIVFFLIHLIPGNPVDVILGERALAVDREALIRQLQLDRPVTEQYLHYFQGLLTGNWGASLFDGRSVLAHLGEVYPATAILAICAMLMAIGIALPTGILAAVRRGTAWDSGAMLAALIGISVPSFWLGPVLILFFSVYLGWLPISGRESWTSLILPSVSLGAALAAMLSRVTRSSMIEEIDRDYVTAARAKGLGNMQVILKHALRNAMNPIVTVIGLQVGTLLAGTIITEKIFNWPGLGTLLMDSIHRRDYPVVQGCILVISAAYVLINTITDCLYRVVDPRVKL